MTENDNPWESINIETSKHVKREMEFGPQSSYCFTHFQALCELLTPLQDGSDNFNTGIDREHNGTGLLLEQSVTGLKAATAWEALN